MAAGRAKTDVRSKGEMTKAEQVLQQMWDRLKKARDGDQAEAMNLPDGDSGAESGDEEEGDGDAVTKAVKSKEEEVAEEEKLAKLLSKTKKAKIFRGGAPVLKGLARVGAKKIVDDGLLQKRRDYLRSVKERSAMAKAARANSGKSDDTVIEKLEEQLRLQREGKKRPASAWKIQADKLRKAKKLI